MQGDFYTTGKYREKGLQPFDMEKAIDEKPTYVLFNGSRRRAHRRQGAHGQGRRDACACSSATAARTSSRASTSSARSSTRSSYEGGTQLPGERADHADPRGRRGDRGVPRRGAGQLRARRPLDLPRVQQGRARRSSRSRAPRTRTIYSGKEVDAVYLGDRAGRNLAAVATAADGRQPQARSTARTQVEAGEALFAGTCSVCHQANGAGPARRVPAAGQVRLPRRRHAARDRRSSLHGLSGPVTVNGKDVQLGDAADEPAQRRRDRQHPDLRAATAGATRATRCRRTR